MTSEPIELSVTFVPLTHSRVREMIDRLESRMMNAVADRKNAQLDIKIENGATRIVLLIEK